MSAELVPEDLFCGMAEESTEYEIMGYGEEEEPAQYQFATALDEVVCENCSPLNGEVFTEDEVDEWFPDYQEITPDVIQANIHPNCRCELLMISGPETEDVLLPELL
jgi:hypothetical protein